jgi:RNA polymerase sigma factor (sigma-70 family)
MDDREIVAAIAAGDLAGLADAYDEHAGSLYGYCHWMLGDPDDASDTVQDTFVTGASRLGSLGDPRKLRPWLYAVARNECQLRLDGAEPGLAETEDTDEPYADMGSYADMGDAAGQAELREFVRTALDGLNPAEREVIELDLRHDLHGADLAAVLGVPRNQAHDLATRARGRLERALGALLVARTGRQACPDLDMLLDGWDGELTPPDRKQIDRHIDQCDICAGRIERMLRPATEQGMVPLFGPPLELRDEVLQLCTSSSPGALAYRREVTQRAGPFRPNGFPEPIKPPRRRRVLALSGTTAAVAGVVIAIAATGIVAAIALTGGHPQSPAASGSRSASQSAAATSSGAVPSSSGTAGGVPIDAQPTISAVASVSSSTAPAAPAPSSTPAKARPSPSHPATPVASTPSTRPTFTFSPPAPSVSPSNPGTSPTSAAPG